MTLPEDNPSSHPSRWSGERDSHSQEDAPALAHRVEFGEETLPSTQIDEETLERLWRRGAKAWAHVDNPTQWVEELRGH